jgi:C4-dicarboxylate-specific signal transduction histidine kinase
VLLNLLVNARDALTALPDGAPRQVRIAAMAEPGTGMVRLTVADTAGGIAAAVLPTLFEPFVTTKGPDRGTGLGLSICYGLLRGMGGSIAAANDRDGAVFTVLLPAASAEDIAAE